MVINNSISNPGIFCPHIKTEETIRNLLIRDSELVSDEYEYMPYPLAHWINTIGVPKTQKIIDSLNTDKKRIFVCQHIRVDRLKFNKSDIVFTPHSSTKDSFITIPHYAVNVDTSLSREKRSIDFSFLGSTSTHTVRKRLVSMYNTCYDSGVHWGLDKNLKGDFTKNYISLLGNSNFSICPRGTGISSVRLFESMSMGSIPIIVADNYGLPLSDIIDWDKITISVKENDISNMKSIVGSYSKECVFEMRNKLIETYYTYFSNDKLHKTIIETLI